MAVTYTKAQRELAKKENLALITVVVPGMEFQGPTTKEEATALLAYMVEFIKRRGRNTGKDEQKTK